MPNNNDRGAVVVVAAAAGIAAMALLPGRAGHAQEPGGPAADEPVAVEPVEVIGVTPVHGIDVPKDRVPANVREITGEELDRRQAPSLDAALNESMSSVHVNEGQANPFQPDVFFRGFTASPLLGAPQGLSVYQDGVRINEPFGDVVNWDLVPAEAIASVHVIPGANPVFGLNTLGGALSVRTRDGHRFTATEGHARAGSFGREDAMVRSGGHGERLAYFASGRYIQEDGWRDFSDSEIRRAFGKVSRRTADLDLSLSYTFADNFLRGTQALPLSLLDDREQPYTAPDETDNLLNMVNLEAERYVGDAWLISGDLYLRDNDTESFNSDTIDEDDFDPAQPVTPDNPAGSNDTVELGQQGYGATLQASFTGGGHRATAGVSLDRQEIDFTQRSQPADFTAGRVGFAIGPAELLNDLDGTNEYLGLYASDTYSLNERLHLTLSGRYNRATVEFDGITRADTDDPLEPLSGDHTFERFNPALGLAYTFSERLRAYGSYQEGMRAPTPVELSCADPAAPCTLPNELLADPPLDEVVAHSMELGLERRGGDGLEWSAAVFRTELEDDLIFVSTQTTGSRGFFDNVDETRRQGVELAVGRRRGPWRWRLAYSYVEATYETRFRIASPDNSTADANGQIRVSPGDRIPGIPAHRGRLAVDYAVTPAWEVGATVIAVSEHYARGDDNNADANGPVPGYGLVNLRTRYRLGPRVALVGRIDNLLDKEYSTLGVLGVNAFTAPGDRFNTDPDRWRSEQFRSPGAPLGVWVGVEARF